MVSWNEPDHIHDPESELLRKLEPQLEHARWHGWTPIRWRVGSHALDRGSRHTEDITAIMGIRVELDCTLPRNAIRLEAH